MMLLKRKSMYTRALLKGFMFRLLVGLMVLALFSSAQSLQVSAAADPQAAVPYSGAGEGSEQEPYQIATPGQLNEVRNHMASGTYFILTDHINLDSYANWVPIGNTNDKFEGNVDGNGYSISDLVISRRSENYIGLFGSVGGSSKITHMKLENVNITGKSYVGGLIGMNEGTIINSYVTGNVIGAQQTGGLVGKQDNGSISDSFSTATVSGSGSGIEDTGGLVGNSTSGLILNSYATGAVNGTQGVGGLVGISQMGTISESYATGIVNSASQEAGGLVGKSNDTQIRSSYANGGVFGRNSVGGLVGFEFTGSISDSYATGTVQGVNAVGGLVGNGYDDATIIHSYATGSVSGSDRVGGVLGYNQGMKVMDKNFYDKTTAGLPDTGNIEGKITAEMKIKATFTSWDSLTWFFVPNQYPQLWAFVDLAQGTQMGQTTINNVGPGMEFSFDGDHYFPIYVAGGVSFFANAGDEIYVRIQADPSSLKILTVDLADIQPNYEPTTGALEHGSNIGKTMLTGVTDLMEYKVNTGTYQAITGTSVDDIAVQGDKIFIRVKATELQPASAAQILRVTAEHVKPATITTAAIEGVTVPVSGATPVTTLIDTNEYIATIAWSPVATIFAAGTAYTATITIIPTAGHTLTGVAKDFFTVAGATTTTNAADIGVITAVFPATAAAPITIAAIAGVTVPVKGATPVSTLADTPEYTATIAWSPAAATFAASTAYTATITITPTAGHTLTGVVKDFFTVAGATTTTNGADSGVITAVFPTTAAAPISSSAITGVTVPVKGATPVTTLADTAEYTATIAWSPVAATFAANTAYTATITITPTTGHTLTGVAKDFFTVAGAITTTNAANSGVITAVFPATAVAPSVGGGGGGSSTSNPTDGKLNLSSGKSGEVSLAQEVVVTIPAYATSKDLKLTIDKVLNHQNLLTNKDVLASSIFEILKNFPENFSNPVTLTFKFDPTKLSNKQRPAVFYYDEAKKIWVEVTGGKISGNQITVEVNHFTKFAVFVVGEEATEVPSDKPTDPNPTTSISDIAGHWAEANIKQAVNSGIVKGYTSGTFKPDATVTRAEFAVMLMNALKPQDEGGALTFTDTSKIGAWAQKSIAQAVQADIIKGNSDGTFRPNAEVTRAEMAVMIARAMSLSSEGNSVTGFADDKNIPTWAKGAVAAMKKLNLVEGKGTNQFDPTAQATRAEAVTILLKMLAQKNK
ncbi:S-layer homology domain-containing protein [Cohnella sp. WQ 127256]|uniref:S-layer homology domain-containing protein n=1 Tax=Cohnella sp. WQ 127256 TaxID=2938790 RepID=UPI00211926BB|nr:S-layer homology domain-containing protein [Cohnella sp. WQ 127256]